MNLGEMEKGKIRKGSIFLCASCWDQLNDYPKPRRSDDIPDFLKKRNEWAISKELI